MKNIKLLVKTNRVIFGITLLLYLTIFLGLYAQIVLGVFQVITALVLAMSWTKLTTKNRKKLSLYLTLVAVYLILWFIPGFNSNNYIWLKVSIVPMSIAGYFTYVAETLIAKRRNVFSLG